MKGKTLIFAVVVAGIAGAFWLAVRNFPRPELQPADNDKEPAKVELDPPAPKNNDSDLRSRIQTLAEMIARDDKTEAQEFAEKFATTAQYEDMMPLFLPRGKKGASGETAGMGIGPEPGAVRPDGIEAMLLLLGKKTPDELDLATLMPMANRVVAIAEVLRRCRPTGEMGLRMRRRRYLAEFDTAARAFAVAVKEKDRSKLPAAAQRLNQACYGCHLTNGGAPLVRNLKAKTTDDLFAIVKDGGGTEIDARAAALNVIGQRGGDAKTCIPALIVVLKEPEQRVQDSAAAALRALGQKDTTGRPALDECLKSDSPYLRFWFAHQMGGAKSPIAMLVDALKDPDRDVRAKSAELLGHLGEDAAIAVAVLKTTLENDKDEEVRWAATRSLGRFKSDDAVAPLLAALKDKDPIVRGRAALGLAKVGKPAVPGLRAVLKETDRDVKASALGALARIGPNAKDAVPELQALLKADDALLAKLAGDALRKIDPKAAAEAGLK